MADKVDKPKKRKTKAKQEDKGVLASLPSTRPERIGSRRGAAGARAPAPKTTTATAASKSAAGKRSASGKPASAKPKAAGTAGRAAQS